MADTNSFFTLESMGTLAGAAGATFIISSGFQRALNFNPKWLALAIAEVIAIALVISAHGLLGDYIIGVVNGFLIFSTAAGGNSMVAVQTPNQIPRGPANPTAMKHDQKRQFFSKWY